MIKENTDDIYTDKILRPATDTFLTAEWDEMVPFPNSKASHILILLLLLHPEYPRPLLAYHV